MENVQCCVNRYLSNNYVNFRGMEANAEEMSMTEIRNLEETVTYALAAIRVNSQLPNRYFF